MAFNKKTWQNRVSEQPQRRLLTPTDGGTPMTVDVTRQEGLVIQDGDAFSAENMNDLETRIKNTFDSDEATLNSVNNKANTNASNISTLQSNLASVSNRVTTNTNSINGLSTRMTAVENKATGNTNSINSLNGRMGTAENNISSLSTRAGNLETRAGALEGRMGTAEGNISSLAGAVSGLGGRLSILEVSETLYNRIYPNLKACLRCIVEDIWANRPWMVTEQQVKFITGLYKTNISAGFGEYGTSGRPWDYSDVCPDLNRWKSVYGYVPIEESGVSYTLQPFPNPYLRTATPYCDIQVYNEGNTRYITLFISSFTVS